MIDETQRLLATINQELAQLQQDITALQTKRDELQQAADHAALALRMVTPAPALPAAK